jgi:hypothetical protein
MPERILDALVGSCMALAVNSLLPFDPKTRVRRVAREIFEDLGVALEEAASALAGEDAGRAGKALWQAREVDARVAGLRGLWKPATRPLGSPPFHRRPQVPRPYAAAADSLDFAVRNTRVLARDAVGLVRRGDPGGRGSGWVSRQTRLRGFRGGRRMV